MISLASAENLQDHLHVRVRCENQPLTFSGRSESEKAAALEAYQTEQRGPIGSNFLEVGAFVKSRPDENVPGLQLFFLTNLAPDFPQAGQVKKHGLTFTSYVRRPLSRGEVTLASGDPPDRPVISFNYLSEQEDMRCSIAGVQWNLRILYTKAFDRIRGEEIAPGQQLRSDSELEEFVRRNASTTWHLVGSCKMGNDQFSVVDAQLRVHGVEGLRISCSLEPLLRSLEEALGIGGRGIMSAKCTIAEMMIAALARTIEDGVLVFHGFGSPLVQLAMHVAKRTHAPNMVLVAGATYGVDPIPPFLAPPAMIG